MATKSTQPLAITNMIIQGVNQYLDNVMNTQIDISDPTKAGIVREGPLQDDPTKYHVSVLTYPNDPDHEDQWLSEVTAGSNSPPLGTPLVTTYEIGGGEMWYERFCTTLELFWKSDVNRDTALELSAVVLNRARAALRRMPVPYVDDFGTTSLDLRVMKHQMIPSGGPSSFISHCKIYFQVLCESG